MRTTLCEDLLDVLVVHARPESAKDMASVLGEAGLSALGMPAGDAAVVELGDRRPAVALVDAEALADGDGSLIARLRSASESTIVMVLGPDVEPTRMSALSAGCDVYALHGVTAPELVATVRAALRLLRRLGDQRRDEVYDDGLVRIDAPLRHVEVGGAEVALTPLEFRLLLALVRGRDRVVSREELLEATWHGAAPPDGDHVKLYVHYLRRKLNEHTSVQLIQTVRGFGYRWLGARAHERPEAGRRFRQRQGAAR